MNTQTETETETLIDYTVEFEKHHKPDYELIAAHGKGYDFLALYRVPEGFPDAPYPYLLEYRWLTCSCERETDQSWACVQGAVSTWWYKPELEFMGVDVTNLENLFDHFNLFC